MGMVGCASLKVCLLKVSASGRIVLPPLVQTHPAEVMLTLCEGGGCICGGRRVCVCVREERGAGRCAILGLTFLQHMWLHPSVLSIGALQ